MFSSTAASSAACRFRSGRRARGPGPADAAPVSPAGRCSRRGARAVALTATLIVITVGLASPTAAASTTVTSASTVPVAADLTFAGQQLAATASRLRVPNYPVRTTAKGAWVTVPAADWTSGFFPGALWETYSQTHDAAWLTRARTWEAGVEAQKTDNSSHDIGFQIFSSYGQDAILTGDPHAHAVVQTAAATLATRFNPTVGAFRSWGAVNDPNSFQVIVDNMMNLELMFWASHHGGNPVWADEAATHARTTARDFFRPDGGSYHVVNYDQRTGQVISRGTAQGYSNSSTWSRGEAWAIHGFSTAYRYTADPALRAIAEKAADYFLARLPADKVPYWDFNLPSTGGQPRDSSAAAIAAAGLVDLASQEPDPGRAQTYLGGARDILASLSTRAYLAQGTTNQAILLHGTQNKPARNFDTGLFFGDYFLIQALQRYNTSSTPAPAGPG
jgi:unsaturated chondroitin disaccharide hydrolase